MDLTTLARVRALRGISSTDTASDALLTVLITTVSARAGAYMGRHVQELQRTETMELPKGGKILILRGYPVTTVTSLSLDETVLESGLDYRLALETGILRILRWTPGAPGVVEIDYQAGMASDTADFVTRWPAITGAVDMQVVYEFGRRMSPGGMVETRDGGATFATEEVNWLSGVREVLDMYAIGGRLS